jgi:2-polyprenyl-3-methyl-5-hydroxy-6-metoxy-1,4-benzoquinol methylase
MADIEEKLRLHQQYIRNQRKQIENLRGRLERMEALWEHSISDPEIKWLYQNRSERMDPSVKIFDEGRADFHLDRYHFAAERVAGLKVADIACGTGYGSELLKEQGGAASVTGIDICPDAINYATKKHAPAGVNFVCTSGDATGLESNSLDAIVSFETIEHVPDDEKLLTEFARILKPGGLLICSTPNMWPLEIAPHHVRVYDRNSFAKILNRNFESIEMFNQNSGTSFQFNRDQERGILPTDDTNHELAECFLAVAKKKN